MRIKYEATLEELVDVTLRSLARSRVARSWFRFDVVAPALVFGLVVGAALFDVTPNIESRTSRLTLAVVVGVLGALLCLLLLTSIRRNRLRRYFREMLDGDGPYPFAVELSPEGMQMARPGSRTLFEWSQVSAVEETEEGIGVVLRQVGLQLIPARAFASEEDMRAFASEMRRYRELIGGTVGE
jgi:hypothetical protein